MLEERDAQAIDAAKLYYLAGMSQATVAEELGVSRPTVSKLLHHAREAGYVTISIRDPREDSDELSDLLVVRFGLSQAHITHPPAPDLLLESLGSMGAAVLESVVADGVSIGVSWGETMAAVAHHLRPQQLVGASVVQLKGGHSHTERSTKDVETITTIARALHADMHLLPLPVIFDSVEAKEWVVRDRHIAHILDLGAHVDVAVFTVGAVEKQSLALNLGYLSEEETEVMLARAVGDACSRFFTAVGEVALEEVDQRTVGIKLQDLRKRPVRLLVAGGVAKSEAIRVALEMGLATHLVIDHDTAVRVLDDQEHM